VPSEFEFEGIDWEGGGYFGPSALEGIVPLPGDPLHDMWRTWMIVFERAKHGRFDGIDVLLDLYANSSDPVLQELCVTLLGDAAPDSTFVSVIHELENPANPTLFEISLDYCDALAARGRLGDVPLILKVYQSKIEVQDADIFPLLLSDILGSDELADETAFASLDHYSSAVRQRYDTVVRELGSVDLYVYKGRIFSVIDAARYILDCIRGARFSSGMRRKFEACTGIDCSGFYKGGRFQPLSAAAILETFLASDTAARYENGVRYFFGHRIPTRGN